MARVIPAGPLDMERSGPGKVEKRGCGSVGMKSAFNRDERVAPKARNGAIAYLKEREVRIKFVEVVFAPPREKLTVSDLVGSGGVSRTSGGVSL
ncbi:hypothetical protein QTI66_32910 [Variovorax sp. J22R133]|uniref:hypothetical protein n=1 Tax=Variovorax brevis TaxID=3053503 RepID=UPI002577BECA|nr:hypothetical protein [Variovorax sp. J22R133]MDM0116930.1 hypothetical protein [Variovorax sp. J22R133]